MQANNALTAKAIAKMIDHSLLQPDMTDADIIQHCRLAKELDVATVCVRPYDVALCRKELAGSEVAISVVVGFPHANTTTATKLYEAQQTMDDGATELDLVMAYGKARSGEWGYVEEDLRVVTEAAHARKVCIKVILENHYLTQDEIVTACRLCEKVGADFVKTSTGYAPGGALASDIRLMRSSCGPQVAIKAAGGIRTLDDVLEMFAAGSTRQGTRSTEEIVQEAARREAEGKLVLPNG